MRKLTAFVLLSALTGACSNPLTPAPTFAYAVRTTPGSSVTVQGHTEVIGVSGEYDATGSDATLRVALNGSGCVFAAVIGPSQIPYGDLQCGDSPTVTVTGR